MKIRFVLAYLILSFNLSAQAPAWTSGSGILYTPSGTKIGIGTSTPLHELHVNGNLLIPSDKKLRIGTENTTDKGFFTLMNSIACKNTYADFNGHLYFRRVGKDGSSLGAALSLQSDGTVLIGIWERYDNALINTNGYSLMVNGGILAEKMKIVSDVPTSDFVFEEDYKLLSLKEVEAFVKKNKHLPEIPSAKEFQKNGYSVGEMDDLLLRKVEELTLYMIELKKENEKLQQQILELKNK